MFNFVNPCFKILFCYCYLFSLCLKSQFISFTLMRIHLTCENLEVSFRETLSFFIVNRVICKFLLRSMDEVISVQAELVVCTLSIQLESFCSSANDCAFNLLWIQCCIRKGTSLFLVCINFSDGLYKLHKGKYLHCYICRWTGKSSKRFLSGSQARSRCLLCNKGSWVPIGRQHISLLSTSCITLTVIM